MRPFAWISRAWILAVTLVLTGISCATHKNAVLSKDGLLPPSNNSQIDNTASEAPSPAAKATVQAAYGKLPLSFEANQGQTDERVNFLSRGSGYTLFLTSTEAVLALKQQSAVSDQPSASKTQHPNPQLSDPRPQTLDPSLTLRMQLVGANPNPHVAGLEELPGKVNYFRGSDPQKWRTNIPTYAKVKYEQVYPGVDLVYYGNQRQLEYDFVVAPGADPKTIRLAFDGLVGAIHELPLRIADNGDLVLLTDSGEVRFLKPQIYQEIDDVKQPIPGRYVLLESESSDPRLQTLDSRPQQVGIEVAAYDTSKPLIIDPVLSYSISLGGGIGARIAVDASGNAYVMDVGCFVAKINAAGSALVYSTSLGGADACGDIAVDTAGNAYVVGTTSSPDFPATVNSLQSTLGGGSDAFVAKLNAAGSALVYSTFLGGSGTEFAGGNSAGGSIAVDAAGNAYVTGITCSSDFPTMNPIQATNHGGDSSCGFDAFVAKINAEGSALVYSTYLGSSGHEEVAKIAVDAASNAYVTGRTYASDFPTANPLQAVFGGGDSGVNADAFVTKINAAGSALVYSTFLGGSARDYGGGIGVDAAGNAVVTGLTFSADFPTMNPIQVTPGSNFVTKINAAGSVVYSTFLGGSEDASTIAVDAAGNAYVAGVCVTKLDAAGSAIIYSTCLFSGRGIAIAVDAAGNAYVTANGLSVAKLSTAAAETPVGTNVMIQPIDDAMGTTPVTLTFSEVTQAGMTSLTTNSSGPAPPAGFTLGDPPTYYHLTTTALFSPPITVCVDYSSISFGDESQLKLFHFENYVWVDRTVSLDTLNNVICASVDSLSPFAIFEPSNVAPTVGAITAPVDPVRVGTNINTSASFMDLNVLDTHMALWDWDDGTTSSGAVTETGGSGLVNGNHTYTTAGVYTVTLTVTDNHVNSGQSIFQFVVIYDPSAGFVTGGGWIDSPAGAYTLNPSLTGKATFGFVSKYQKGATVPTGQTEFQFQVANLNFHSTSYQWLVIAGAKAKYKGSGTINNSGNYDFMLTAIDGQVNGGGGVDKFRIKIRDKATSTVVYDNQLNDPEDADATDAIEGGSIVIHK